mgnify:CR=1 FL=1
MAFPKTDCRFGVHSSPRFNVLVLPCLCSSSASSARISRISSDSANFLSHCFSVSRSSSSCFANAFCSTSGNCEAFSNAFSSNVVITNSFLFPFSITRFSASRVLWRDQFSIALLHPLSFILFFASLFFCSLVTDNCSLIPVNCLSSFILCRCTAWRFAPHPCPSSFILF